MTFAAKWMDLEIIILNEVRQISYNITYIVESKNGASKLIYKTEMDSQTQKTDSQKQT